MRLKIACRPRIRNSVAQKFISSSLIIGLLFNNISSLASVLSEDSRYETFEGDSITINNILEEDTVDAEIEGNSLVNILHPTMSNLDVENTSDSPIGLFNTFNKELVKPSTVYTIISNIELNTGSRVVINNNELTASCFTDAIVYSEGEIGTKIRAVTSKSDLSSCQYVIRPYVHLKGRVKGTIMVLEGDWSDKEIPEYFEGIKSVGELEDNKLNIESIGENLFNVEYFKEMIETHYHEGNYGYEVKDGRNTIWTVNNHHKLHTKNLLNNNYKFKENTQYIIKSDVFLDGNFPTAYGPLLGIVHYKDDSIEYIFASNTGADNWCNRTVITNANKTIKNIAFSYGQNNSKSWFDLDSLYIGEYNPDKTEFNYDYNIQNIKIDLKEPLRGFPNSIKDRIIKKNGQWCIERNVGYKTLNGSENWEYPGGDKVDENSEYTQYYTNAFVNDNIDIFHNLYSDKLLSDTTGYNGNNEAIMCGWTSKNVHIRILKSRLKENNSSSFKEWISENPITVLYKLKTPIYEPLNIDPTINLYKNTAHISNNSTIPANIKVTVDRTLNRAHEAIDAAKSNPTVDNIAIARMWVNLLEDSSLKDELQDDIGEITQVKDMQIERKTVSSNIDLYVRSENALSMGLSTSSVTFDNYSSVSDSEMLNAVEVTIHSSLPYSFNTYLETPIESLDGQATIQPNTLSIRENSKTYQVFNNVKEKIVLNDNTDAGNNNIHNIDLKLSKNTADKANVYKTTIKFEAVQK
ncbi:MAG: hypothetical protein IJ086_00625 [Clostridium sp.]|nr:hypothetical protein [Clostridium sp.]